MTSPADRVDETTAWIAKYVAREAKLLARSLRRTSASDRRVRRMPAGAATVTDCPKFDEPFAGERVEHGPALPPHPCPFGLEVWDDRTPCRCCAACSSRCSEEA